MKLKSKFGVQILALVLLGGLALAQDPDSMILPGDKIKVDKTKLKEELEKYNAYLREGDAAIMKYLGDSTESVVQGHNRACESFKVWYRKWEDAKEHSDKKQMELILNGVLTLGLKFIFPEEEAFVKALKFVAEMSQKEAMTSLPSEGDVNLFVDTVCENVGKKISVLKDAPQAFREKQSNAFLTAKEDYAWEVIEKAKQDAELPKKTKEYLGKVGVPEPGSGTIKRATEGALAGLIEAVFREDKNITTTLGGGISPWAMMSALSHLDRAGNKDRICYLASGFSAMLWPAECIPPLPGRKK